MPNFRPKYDCVVLVANINAEGLVGRLTEESLLCYCVSLIAFFYSENIRCLPLLELSNLKNEIIFYKRMVRIAKFEITSAVREVDNSVGAGCLPFYLIHLWSRETSRGARFAAGSRVIVLYKPLVDLRHKGLSSLSLSSLPKHSYPPSLSPLFCLLSFLLC